MKAKLLVLSAVFMTMAIFFGGCKNRQKDPNEVLYFLKNLDSYSADFDMEIKNDKQTINQDGKQYYDRTEGYRLELGQDRLFLYKGDNIYVQDVKNNFRYTLDKEFNSGYKVSFINEYINLLYTNEEIKYDIKETEGKKYQLIELVIPGGVKEQSKAVMYVDTKTCFPQWIFVYDDKDNERIKITYKNFQANPELKPELFKTE